MSVVSGNFDNLSHFPNSLHERFKFSILGPRPGSEEDAALLILTWSNVQLPVCAPRLWEFFPQTQQ